MKFHTGDMKASIPFYVTRKTAGGETGEFNMPIGQLIYSFLLVYLNVVAWSIFGLITFVKAMIGLV